MDPGPENKPQAPDSSSFPVSSERSAASDFTALSFEAVVRQAAVAFVVTDPAYRIQVWSAGAERLLGYAAADVVGKPYEILIPQGSPRAGEQSLRERVLAEEQVLFFASDCLAKDGRNIPVEVCRSVVRDREGRPVATTSVLLDQTEKRTMQERILQSERLVALARVVGKVFHELRTPLGVLVLEAEILSEEVEELLASAGDRVDATLGQRVRGSLSLFMREIQRIEGLAEDYLLMIRPIKPHRSPQHLGDFLETVRTELESKSHRAGYEIAIRCRAPNAQVWLDSLQMLRVFHNLAGNSLDAIPEEKEPRIEIDADVEGTTLVVRMRDNGPGLPPELAGGGAFEIFTTTKRVGSGLGLHLVQEIVFAHGGTIDLRNHPQGGAEATVRIPMEGMQSHA
jgi:two-component system, NtrC family, sensor histidine kinase AtoS